MKHVLKVEPGSEAERRLMELFAKIEPSEEISCRLGALFGLSYNTYQFSEGAFQALKKVIDEEEL